MDKISEYNSNMTTYSASHDDSVTVIWAYDIKFIRHTAKYTQYSVALIQFSLSPAKFE